jgi:hypothetical protein
MSVDTDLSPLYHLELRRLARASFQASGAFMEGQASKRSEQRVFFVFSNLAKAYEERQWSGQP